MPVVPSPRAHVRLSVCVVTCVVVALGWAARGSAVPPAGAAGVPQALLAQAYPAPGSAVPPAVAAGAPPCRGSQLRVTRTLRPEHGRVGGEVVATNTSAVTCALRGSPRLALVDADGTSVDRGAVETPGTVTSPVVTLAPARAARAALIWWSYCGPPLVRPVGLATPWGVGDEPVADTGGATVEQTPPCVIAAPPGITVLPWAPVDTPAPRDERYYPQTGFRVDDDTIGDYVDRRGGVAAFGYPISRTFVFQGFVVQFFQRRVVQLDPDGHARLLNLLDSDLLPYTRFNFGRIPARDPTLAAAAPSIDAVRRDAPDSHAGIPVRFYQAFLATVPSAAAFPTGGDARLVPGFALEMWGVPTSRPAFDPNNRGVVYLRWQRGVMQYDAATGRTQGVLLADYLKSVLTGTNLPADLASEARDSPFYRQYDPSVAGWVRDPVRLRLTDLTNAFAPQ